MQQVERRLTTSQIRDMVEGPSAPEPDYARMLRRVVELDNAHLQRRLFNEAGVANPRDFIKSDRQPDRGYLSDGEYRAKMLRAVGERAAFALSSQGQGEEVKEIFRARDASRRAIVSEVLDRHKKNLDEEQQADAEPVIAAVLKQNEVDLTEGQELPIRLLKSGVPEEKSAKRDPSDCMKCHFPTELDDRVVETAKNGCICLNCFGLMTETKMRMSKGLELEVRAATSNL